SPTAPRARPMTPAPATHPVQAAPGSGRWGRAGVPCRAAQTSAEGPEASTAGSARSVQAPVVAASTCSTSARLGRFPDAAPNRPTSINPPKKPARPSASSAPSSRPLFAHGRSAPCTCTATSPSRSAPETALPPGRNASSCQGALMTAAVAAASAKTGAIRRPPLHSSSDRARPKHSRPATPAASAPARANRKDKLPKGTSAVSRPRAAERCPVWQTAGSRLWSTASSTPNRAAPSRRAAVNQSGNAKDSQANSSRAARDRRWARSASMADELPPIRRSGPVSGIAGVSSRPLPLSRTGQRAKSAARPDDLNRRTAVARFIDELKRTHSCGALRASDIDREVVLFGWVANRRDHGALIFVDLRDREGITQIVFDPDVAAEAHQLAEAVRSEWVIGVRGVVRSRGQQFSKKKGEMVSAANPNLATGEIELVVHELTIFNKSETPPFEIADNLDTREEVRLAYRYLDLRRPNLQNNLKMRHAISQATRNYLSEQGCLELETPFLVKYTPGGARNFLVPSRLHPGSFYALAESPQLFKQLFMVAGYDRYFQIVRCFRDEDQRLDRQLEFTQIDIELSFVNQDD